MSRARTPRPALRASFVGLLALVLTAPAPAIAAPLEPRPAPALDEGDDAYAYLVGLLERELFDLAIDEARAFLQRFPGHARAPMARYRLATTLFDLGRRAEAREPFVVLARDAAFEFRAECLFRLGQCELEAERLDAAGTALAGVLGLDAPYLHGPARFLLGEVDFQAGRDAAAAGRWSSFLEDHADSEYAAAARRGLAWCAWRQGDAAGAAAACAAYLQRHGDLEGADEVRVLFGEVLLEAGAPERALEVLGEVSAADQLPAAWRGLGFAHAALGQHAQAAAAFARVPASSPLAAEAELQRGVELVRAGRYADAVASLTRTARGGDPEALFWLANAQAELGRDGDALGSLDRALAGSPTAEQRTRLAVARGDALTRLGRGDEARAAYEGAGSDWALHAAAVAALNEALGPGGHEGAPAGGASSANSATSTDGGTPDTTEAERLARQLLERHPGSDYAAKTRLVLGEALFARGSHAQARASFAAVAGADVEPADRARALARLAWCHYLEGSHAEAAAAFTRVLADHPTSAEAQEAAYMGARSSRDAGDADAASVATRRYLDLYPTGVHGPELLLAEGLAGEGAARLEALVRLVDDFPGDELVPDALFELGERLSALGEADQAVACYGMLVERHGDHDLAARARYGRAWCLYGAGDFDAALTDLAAAAGAGDAELAAAAHELAAWSELGAGRPAAAARAWERFAEVSADPRRVFETGLAIAAAWREAGGADEALELLDRQVASLSGSEGTSGELAVATLVEAVFAALDGGDLTAAEARLDEAVARGQVPAPTAGGPRPAPSHARPAPPAVLEAAFFVGEARFAAGDLDRAATHYRLAAGTGSPVVAEALYKLGFGLLQQNDAAAAEAPLVMLTEGHATSPLFGEGLFLLGEARFRRGDHAGAVAPLTTLTERLPDHAVVPKARFRLGLALGHEARWAEAERVLARLSKDSPSFPNLAEAELWRGRALGAQAKSRAASQAFERCIALDAAAGGAGVLSAQARLGLGRLAQAEGRDDDALSEYLKVAVLFADDEAVAEALLLAGGCLERLGDPDGARGRYREVVDAHPKSSSVSAAREALRRLDS